MSLSKEAAWNSVCQRMFRCKRMKVELDVDELPSG
jgi:hypothetical protein